MVAKKQEEKVVHNVGAHIEHVNITNTSAANKHTRMAVESLAAAITANAQAIIAVAEALKGAPANMTSGIHLDNLRGS